VGRPYGINQYADERHGHQQGRDNRFLDRQVFQQDEVHIQGKTQRISIQRREIERRRRIDLLL
jgi:hypothetical protein